MCELKLRLFILRCAATIRISRFNTVARRTMADVTTRRSYSIASTRFP
jgi:hypothetical protein